MKIPSLLKNTILNSEDVKQEIKRVSDEAEKRVQEAEEKFKLETKQGIETEKQKWISELDVKQKAWAEETAETMNDMLEKKKREDAAPRQHIVTSTSQNLTAKEQESGKRYGTLYTLFSDSPGSIQCINRTAESVIGAGYALEKIPGEGGTKKDLKKLIRFFDCPNPDDTIETFIEAGLTNYLGYGDWFTEKVPTKGTANRQPKQREIAEIYNLDSSRTKILVNQDEKKRGVLSVVGYSFQTESSKKIVYNEDEIIHARRTNFQGGVYGKAILETNSAMLQLLLRALNYNISLLRNGGISSLEIKLPEDSNENDANAVMTFYEKNFMGAHNAGKPLVLFKGADTKDLGLSPQDMAYLELLNYGMRLVAGQYGVPLMMIGFPDGTNRATASEMRRNFYYSIIYPLRKIITNRITKDIIQDGMGIKGWKFSFRGAGLEESEASRRDIMSAVKQGLMNWNEARVKIGLLPVPQKWADQLFLVGSKNDSMIPVKDAIGAEPEDGAQDVKDPKNEPKGQPGEGADEDPEGGDDGDKS